MNTRLIGVLCVAVGACSIAVADTVRVEGGPLQANSGGEFTLTPVTGFAGHTGSASDLSAGTFQSFCLERNQPIILGPGSSGNANVYDFQITSEAQSGGFGGGNPDPISAATAYLFTQFRMGLLSNYSLSGTTAERLADAAALQIAIWTLEDEYGGTAGQAPANAQAEAWVAEALAAAANASVWGNTIGQVRVLVLSQGGQERQDMLTLIPLPPAAWAGLASLAGLGVYVRRRRLAMN